MGKSARIWLGAAVSAVLTGTCDGAPAACRRHHRPQHARRHQPTIGWQAGTCTTDTPDACSENPSQFFEQAAGHPQVGFTQIIVKHKGAFEEPTGHIKTVRVDLPQWTERQSRGDPASAN